MMVWIVFDSIPYEGDRLCSVWVSEADAEEEAKRLGALDKYGHYYVDEYDVRGR